MKMQFLGVGSAFTLPSPEPDGSVDLNKCDWQSNMMLTSESGKSMLIDCGSDIRFALAQQGIMPKDYCAKIDAVYLSHCHADHVGGVEALAFCTYFNPAKKPIQLFCNGSLSLEAWEHSLQGGLASIQGSVVDLDDYFDVVAVPDNDWFDWEGARFTPVQTVHVMAGYIIKHSYGLMIDSVDPRLQGYRPVFITTDTQHCPSQINDFYRKAVVIFQDCETSPFKSGVHAHYSELSKLSEDVKKKMWLYHYQPNPNLDAQKDGFAGFVRKGQKFAFEI
jgi:ribonuclease BN (tRNA processing enzyme)